MAGFADFSGLLTANGLGQRYRYEFAKSAPATYGTVRPFSQWTATGVPAAGAQPANAATGTVYSNTVGSVNFQPTSALHKFMTRLSASTNIDGSMLIFDRLIGYGGIALNSATTINLAALALPRYLTVGPPDTADDVQCWMEFTTAANNAGGVCTCNINYTNQAGTATRVGSTFTANLTTGMPVGVTRMMPLQTGDTGVTSVQSLTISTTNAQGVVNINLMKLIGIFPCVMDVWNERDFVMDLAAMPPIHDGASLFFLWIPTVAGAPRFTGSLDVVYG